MIIKPLKKNVLLAELAINKVTESGIIIESNQGVGESKKAKVLAVGPDCTEVVVDDIVLLDWSKGKVVTLKEGQRIMINENDIAAIL